MGAGSIHFWKNLAADFLAFFDLWKKTKSSEEASSESESEKSQSVLPDE